MTPFGSLDLLLPYPVKPVAEKEGEGRRLRPILPLLPPTPHPLWGLTSHEPFGDGVAPLQLRLPDHGVS